MLAKELVEKIVQYYKAGNPPGFGNWGCEYSVELEDGRIGRCAIGCLVSSSRDFQIAVNGLSGSPNISDLYKTAQPENEDCSYIVQEIEKLFPNDVEGGINFLESIQTAHDNLKTIYIEKGQEAFSKAIEESLSYVLNLHRVSTK